MLFNALHKSYPELMATSFNKQTLRLTASGYPIHVLVSVAEGILKRKSSKLIDALHASAEKLAEVCGDSVHSRLVTITKKFWQKANTQGIFSALDSLQRKSKACAAHAGQSQRKLVERRKSSSNFGSTQNRVFAAKCLRLDFDENDLNCPPGVDGKLGLVILSAKQSAEPDNA